MTAPVPRTFLDRRCVCGECWCAQCPHCGETVTRHNLDQSHAAADVARHVHIAHPEKAPAIHGGTSTCPICGRHWWITPMDDCLVPACGHYGTDTSATNPFRPCHRCGLAHARECMVADTKVTS